MNVENDRSQPVTTNYQSPFPLTGATIDHVTITTGDGPTIDHETKPKQLSEENDPAPSSETSPSWSRIAIKARHS